MNDGASCMEKHGNAEKIVIWQAGYSLMSVFAFNLPADVTIPNLSFCMCLLQGPPGPPGLQGPVGAPGIAVSSSFRASPNLAELS